MLAKPNSPMTLDIDQPLGDNKKTKKEADGITQPWPSESTIMVAVRVRPFSEKEQAQQARSSGNKFNFSTEGSMAGMPFSYHTDSKLNASTTISSGGQLRKVVDVLDERVLVFDPPDAESISNYKRALLPVQAYRRFKDMRYAFDRVFHEDTTQEEVFENTTRHLIDGVLNGYNGTLFAYGATGCGKTHTISGTPENPGIIVLTMQALYERMQELEDEKSIEISVSYLEVYNEMIRDLLVHIPGGTAVPSSLTPTEAGSTAFGGTGGGAGSLRASQNLHLREDCAKRMSIAGLSEHRPKGINEVMNLILLGNTNRTMSPTEANETSSRSHAVLQINICQRLKTADISEDFTLATLSIIDLAGSERASVTKNKGIRLHEGANINRSLLALGNCINALCENNSKTHIPYRDSKLTRLLKFSLGGNCKTVMIACVSPSSAHYEETHNTLKYANRAKNIKTKVTKNTLNVDRHVSEYVQTIYELRQEISDLKSRIQNQAKYAELEKSQKKTNEANREFKDMIRMIRATFKKARSPEIGYATLQSQLYITTASLGGLYRWRTGFDEASKVVKEQQIQLQGQDGKDNLNSSFSAASSYVSMVDDIIRNLNDRAVNLTKQMQKLEDDLKMDAVSIQKMESQATNFSEFPFDRLYVLEKKCQALESHNQILTTKLELSDQALSEQFQATQDFMELSSRSLVGLRPEIESVENAGLATGTLNNIYMASITSFTDMTKRLGNTGANFNAHIDPGSTSNQTPYKDFGSDTLESMFPASPRKPVSSMGLRNSRIMSILPEVPHTPQKRYHISNMMPNMSMNTVDTGLAFGSSTLFGDRSPVRVKSHLNISHFPGAGNNLGGMAPVPFPNVITTPHKRQTPMAGLLFSPIRQQSLQMSPVKRRPRGGLRQPRATRTPTKRSVVFQMDIVEEDEERRTTGLRDPSLPSIGRIDFSPRRQQPSTPVFNEEELMKCDNDDEMLDPSDARLASSIASRSSLAGPPIRLSGGPQRVYGQTSMQSVQKTTSLLTTGGPRRVLMTTKRANSESSCNDASIDSEFNHDISSPAKRARQVDDVQTVEEFSRQLLKSNNFTSHGSNNSGDGGNTSDETPVKRAKTLPTSARRMSLAGGAQIAPPPKPKGKGSPVQPARSPISFRVKKAEGSASISTSSSSRSTKTPAMKPRPPFSTSTANIACSSMSTSTSSNTLRRKSMSVAGSSAQVSLKAGDGGVSDLDSVGPIRSHAARLKSRAGVTISPPRAIPAWRGGISKVKATPGGGSIELYSTSTTSATTNVPVTVVAREQRLQAEQIDRDRGKRRMSLMAALPESSTFKPGQGKASGDNGKSHSLTSSVFGGGGSGGGGGASSDEGGLWEDIPPETSSSPSTTSVSWRHRSVLPTASFAKNVLRSQPTTYRRKSMLPCMVSRTGASDRDSVSSVATLGLSGDLSSVPKITGLKNLAIDGAHVDLTQSRINRRRSLIAVPTHAKTLNVAARNEFRPMWSSANDGNGRSIRVSDEQNRTGSVAGVNIDTDMKLEGSGSALGMDEYDRYLTPTRTSPMILSSSTSSSATMTSDSDTLTPARSEETTVDFIIMSPDPRTMNALGADD